MQFLKLRSHLGDASALATSRYPETLDSILVCIAQVLPVDPTYVPLQVIGAPPYVETVFQYISQWWAIPVALTSSRVG
jgi:hypothetical protein